MGGIRGELRQRRFAVLLAAVVAALIALAAAIGPAEPSSEAAVAEVEVLPPPAIAATVRIDAKLPRTGPGAARLFVGVDQRSPASVPGKLSELVLSLGRGLRFDVDGVPRCGLSSLEAAVREDERREFDPAKTPCPRAVVGRGKVEIDYSPPGSKPLFATLPLAVLNGGVSRGSTRLFIFGLLPGLVEEPPFIAKVTVARQPGDLIYPSVARIGIPQWGNGYGFIRTFGFTIAEKHQREGEAALSGTCVGFRAELAALYLDRAEAGPFPALSRCIRLK